MIDLSFLTEEEQEAIMKVLQRDAELKRAEEERVRHLPEKIKDDVQLKNMSGQWFYEAKSKRHRDKIHGADIIRASMRRKPATLAEVSQNKSNKAKSSWVSNVNKEVFVPPKLYGVVEHQEEEEEEEVKSSSSSKTITSVLDKPQGQSGKAAVSPVKQRRNPFNSTSSGENPNSGESENGPVSLPQLSKKEILSPSKENQPKTNLLTNETEKPKKSSVEPTNQSQRSPVKPPVPKARKFIQKATDPVSQKEDIVPKPAKRTDRVNGISTPPRGILKRSSSSSSTDSEVLRVNQMFDAQTKSGLPTSTIFEGETEKNSAMEEAEDSSQISLEKLKQVRFSSSIGKGEPLQSPQLHHGREIGEFDLLESDEIKSSENDAIRSDSLGNKQISAVKPLGIYSSALQVNEIDHLQEDTLASSPSDTNRSVFLASETLQTKTVPSKKLETPRRPSSTVLPNNNKELIVDETRENKSNQFLSHESKSLKNSPDQHLLSAKTEARGVSNTNSAGLQQGKPDLVEERDAKTTCKPDKHAADLVKTSDESVSKVLDWFKRSSGAGDRKPRYARLRGREPKEDVDFSTRTAVLTTEHSGPSMDGKTQVTEELPFGKTEKLKSVSPPACILEDTQLIKERRKPKQGEKNEKENDKSLTGFDCRRAEEKESDQEIMHQNQKSSLLEHQEYKQPSQRYESEKAIREKRRIREIRAFWEREKTIPSHGEKEAGVSINASDGSMLKGLKESDKIKPTAVYLPNVLDDQSNNMLRRTELSDESQVSRNEHQNSFEFEPGHAAEKLERTLPSDGEVHECTKPPKANNLQPRVGVTSFSPKSKYKNEKEMFQGKGVSCSQEKPNFKVLSLKEKMNEKPKNQVSNPSQFQSLRNFWDTGVKLQSSIDEGDVSLPNNTSSVTYQRESKEDKKGRGKLSKQDLIQQQIQATEREKTEKLDSAVCELPLESPTLKGLNVSQTKNTDSIQLVRKAFISKPKEKVGLPEQEAKEYIEKSIVSSKEHQNTFNSGLQKLPQVSLQLFQSPDDKDALKQEMAVDDQLCLSIETVENKTTPLDADLPKEEVVEIVDKFVLPKAGLDVFKLSLKKLEKEASEMSPGLNIKENISKGTAFYSDQYIFFERSVEQNHDISSADQKEKIRENSEKMDVPSIGKDENAKKGLGELFGEFEPFYQQHQAADKDKTLGASSDFFLSPSQKLFEKLLKEAAETSPPEPKGSDSAVPRIAEMPVGSATYQHDAESPQEVGETVERSVAPSKASGFSSALGKLLKEAAETSPPEPKGSDSAVPRIAEMPAGSATYQHDAESPQEVGETVERSVAPSKASGFSSALGKLLKEAAETSPPEPKGSDSAVPRIAEMPAGSATYQHDAESPQEVGETVERSVAPSKASGFSSALGKLLKEAAETSPPEPKGSDSAVPRIAEMPAGSATYQHDAESPQEVGETVERSVAPSKASGFSSALGKLLKEAAETSPPEPKGSDSAVPRIAEMPAGSATYQHDAESPQEVGETVERSVAPSKASGFSSALGKLLKEAAETSPPEPKGSDSAVPRIAEMPAGSATYQHDAESPQEVGETIERSVAPSKASGFSSALGKLLKEAAETSPPEPKGSDSAVPRIAEMPAGSATYQHDAESPQEVGETVERSVAPSKASGFSSALGKLLKEAAETSPPEPKGSDSAVPRIAEMPAGSATYQHDAESPQEVGETVERSVAPSKASGFSSALGKLLKEAAETSPPEPKGSDSAVPRIAEMPAGSATYQRDAESPQEVSETIERSVAPSKASGFSSALGKLLKEAAETSPPEPKGSDRAVPRIAEMPASSATYQRDAESPQEVSETIERSVAPSKAVYEVFNINLQKLLKEVSEMPAPMLKNMDKKMEDKILTSQCMCAPYHQERDHPQEIKETIKKTFVSTHTDFSEVSSSLEKLPKEASEYSSPISKELHVQGKFQDPMSPSNKDTLSMTMPQPYYNALSNYHTRMKIGIKRETLEQNGKASLADRVVNEVEVSDLPKRNVTLHEREKRNTAPTDVPPLERETKTITIKSFKMNEKIKTAESTSLVASENNSELKAPLKLRRASTPLKDESNSPQLEAAQLWLTSRRDNEEEGDSSSLGSEFSDENSDSHIGTRSSTRSEEELNPVLMALKRSADRKMPSKSLEDIPSATSNKGKINIPKEELALSAEDVSTVPSQPDKLLSNPEKLKGLSKSVPSFLQEESDDRETDTASERSYSFGRIKKSPSSLTNLSSSSGMASLSSVSGSLMSIYSGDFGNVDVKGNIQFAIDYVEQLNELHIFICQCKDLAVADVKQQRSDPYVKTYLLPEKYKLGKRKTSVKKKTFNPVYNEILRYKIEKAVLKKQRLNISVWHNDTFGRNSFLGEVELDLGTWDWNEKTNKQINWFPLKPRASTMALEVENRAEMKLALQYVPRPVGGKKIPSTGEVHIWVKECHDLPLQKGNRINSFIKCTILPDTSRKSRQKTRTVAKTTNPVFNHTMVYDGFRPEDLKEACVELTVWDHNKLANHFLGGLRIGLGTGKSYGTTVDWMDSTSAETALWEKMMNSPNTWIEDTLPLRMLMVAKLTK